MYCNVVYFNYRGEVINGGFGLVLDGSNVRLADYILVVYGCDVVYMCS